MVSLRYSASLIMIPCKGVPMRKYVYALAALLLIVYGSESYFGNRLNTYLPLFSVEYRQNDFSFTWPAPSYPVYYEIEVFSGSREPWQITASDSTRLKRLFTLTNNIRFAADFPESAFIRISAHSILNHPLGGYSEPIMLSRLKDLAAEGIAKPTATLHYPLNAPSTSMVMFQWKSLAGAVYYEFELLDAPPENPNGIEHSEHQLYVTREVFSSGCSLDASGFFANKLYWRVRGLDFNGNPVGVFSDAEEIYIDNTQPFLLKPISNTGYAAANMPAPIYPVYEWIPIPGAAQYEVELTNAPPENPNGTFASQFRIWSTITQSRYDSYDDEGRLQAGTYYWRVRGLDEKGKPVGVYSDAEAFTVDHANGHYAATFGDSITHGGGAVSYSPADLEYSFQKYLSFTALNLGKSGDTSETMLERFDSDVLPFKPKNLIIMGGTNSLRGGVPAEQVISELAAIRDKCIRNGIRPIFLTLPPINPAAIQRVFQEETTPEWKSEFARVNAFLRQERYVIDIAPFFMDADGDLPPHFAVDGLHLDISGKKLMGELINANWSRVTR